MIIINKSETADTRTCNYTKVTKDQLLKSSHQHISDVRQGLTFLIGMLVRAGEKHDHTKISGIDQFHADFIGGFKSTTWWDNHRKEERHHLAQLDGIPNDVNLIDVVEFLMDGVMAGLARSGSYRKEIFPHWLLEKAFNNTVDLMLKEVVVKDSDKQGGAGK